MVAYFGWPGRLRTYIIEGESKLKNQTKKKSKKNGKYGKEIGHHY